MRIVSIVAKTNDTVITFHGKAISKYQSLRLFSSSCRSYHSLDIK
jgi:hypothetical protein